MRQRQARYVCKALSFSKSDAHHQMVTNWFIIDHNLAMKSLLSTHTFSTTTSSTETTAVAARPASPAPPARTQPAALPTPPLRAGCFAAQADSRPAYCSRTRRSAAPTAPHRRRSWDITSITRSCLNPPRLGSKRGASNIAPHNKLTQVSQPSSKGVWRGKRAERRSERGSSGSLLSAVVASAGGGVAWRRRGIVQEHK